MILSIPGWERFQHYGKLRRPPWIKLHRQLLENRRWHQLSAEASKMLVSLWLLVSEEEGSVLTGDVVEDIAWRLHCEPRLVLAYLEELEGSGFVAINNKDSSSTLAGRKQGATLEEKREEKEKRKRAPSN